MLVPFIIKKNVANNMVVVACQKSSVLLTNHWLNICTGRATSLANMSTGRVQNVVIKYITQITTNTYTGQETVMSNLSCCLAENLNDLTCWVFDMLGN